MMREHQQQQQQQQNQHQDQITRVLCELSALVYSLLRPLPAPIPFSDQSPASIRRRPACLSTKTINPSGFAFMMLGISLTLMLCGSVTFFIGFLLMPWVIGLVMFFYVVGVVSAVSMLGRSIICSVTAPSSSKKEIPAWKVL